MIRVSVNKMLKAQDSEFNLQIDCTIQSGEIIGLYGDSGAGKTSFLRIMAGLMTPDSGKVLVGGNRWFDRKGRVNLKTSKRSIGYVFQENALFPNMSVRRNLLFAVDETHQMESLDRIVELTQLERLLERMPNSLSGGQQQRVALARAMVREPQVLLLDEPLSALDHNMRSSMQDIILKSQRELGFTCILVTHDMSEIFKMCHRVFSLREGNIVKRGTPYEVFSENRSGGKFSFTGEVIDIVKEDVIYIVTVLIGSQITKVVADESEASNFAKGDRVLVSSKAFNPIIQKIPGT